MVYLLPHHNGELMENLIIITDTNKDPDDLVSFIVAAHLHKQKLININGLITTSGDFKTRKRRALCAKGAFLSMGLDIPVAVGVDYPFASPAHEKYEKSLVETYKSLTNFINSPKTTVEIDSESFLLQRVMEAEDESLTFLLIAGMRDFYNLLSKYPELIKQKTKQVSIMGGVQIKDGKVEADPLPTNNIMDLEAANGTYKILHEMCIPTIIIHKEAVYKAPIPNDLYATLSETGHFLGKYLHENQKQYVQEMFVCVKEGREIKNKSLDWFYRQFTDLPGDSTEQDLEEIWKHTRYTYLYDPMALLACVPEFDFLFTSRKIDHFIFKYPDNRYQFMEEIYRLARRALN